MAHSRNIIHFSITYTFPFQKLTYLMCNVHWKYNMFGIENRPIRVKWNQIIFFSSASNCVALPINKYRAKFAWAILKIGDNETVQKNLVLTNCLIYSMFFKKKQMPKYFIRLLLIDGKGIFFYQTLSQLD